MSIPDGMELIIIVIISIAMSLAGFELGLYGVYILIIWFMGIVAGEGYPLSTVITSEFASTGSLGRLMPTVFTPEGWEKLGTTILYLHGNQ
jgi:PHS family inorganic phosphate transporter-like MFS transporter